MVTSQFGEFDFSADTIGIEIIKALYENGFSYLEITKSGKSELEENETTMEKDLTNAKPKSAKIKGNEIFYSLLSVI